jgi:hypothetical protein
LFIRNDSSSTVGTDSTRIRGSTNVQLAGRAPTQKMTTRSKLEPDARSERKDENR